MLKVIDQYRQSLAWVATAISLAFCLVSLHLGMTYKHDIVIKEARLQVYRDMISSTDYAFIVLNPAGDIVEWGPGAEKLFGWQAHEVLGKSPAFLMPKEFAPQHEAAVNRPNYDFSKTLVSVHCWAFNKAGDKIPIRILAASFRNHVGFYHAAMIAPEGSVRSVQTPEPQGGPAGPLGTPMPASSPCPVERSVLVKKPPRVP